MFYQDLFNCVFGWWRSRRWRRILLSALLPLSLLLLSGGLVLYGAMLSRQTLAARYLTLIEDDLEASFNELLSTDAVASAKAAGSTIDSPVGPGEQAPQLLSTEAERPADAVATGAQRHVQVPMRRILQLGNFNPRVAYVVASQLGRQGRLALAARMMRDIAPLNSHEGFAYAHAWLSNYTTLNWKATEAQAETLLGDLHAAERGGVVLTSGQVRNYASLLIQSKRTVEAIGVLRNYAPHYPELNVLLATLVKQTGYAGVQYQDALAAGRQSFQAKREAGDLLPHDWISAVQLEMLDDALDSALLLAQAGFESDMQNLDLRRVYSDVLLAKHHSLNARNDVLNGPSTPRPDASNAEAESDDAPTTNVPAVADSLPELRYLEAACHVDSSNPALVPEVAKAVALGQRLTPQLKELLERSLVDGTASGITHLILANSKLMSSTPATALPHLRLALRQIPNSPIVMNNLAYAVMKYEPGSLEEAQQLMERALSIPGGTAALRASMLDTLGEIRLTQGATLAAIEMFEQAIELDGSKLGTRRHLVEAYQQAGMPELAAAQQQRLAELDSRKD